MYAVGEANKKLKLTDILKELQNERSGRYKYLIEHFGEYTQPDQSIVLSLKTHFKTDNQANISKLKAQTFIPKKKTLKTLWPLFMDGVQLPQG